MGNAVEASFEVSAKKSKKNEKIFDVSERI